MLIAEMVIQPPADIRKHAALPTDCDFEVNDETTATMSKQVFTLVHDAEKLWFQSVQDVLPASGQLITKNVMNLGNDKSLRLNVSLMIKHMFRRSQNHFVVDGQQKH